MNAGAYRDMITIQRLADPVVDARGFEQEEVWEDFYSNYAYINKLYGTERWTAAQVQMDSIVRFTLRYHAPLDEVMPKRYRILFGARIFAITNVDNVMFKNETVKIDGVEVVS